MTGAILPIDRDERRRVAIERLHTKKAELRLPLSKEGTRKLVHELEAQQIELEKQNEELLRAREELRKSEQRFSRIFDSVPALIGICNLREGRFMDVNQASLHTLGYQRDEIVGKTAQELGLWEDEELRVTLMRDFKEKGSMTNQEVRFKAKNGKILTGLCSAELIDLDEERYMLILVRDITERKAAEEEVERLNITLRERADVLEDVNRELEAFNYTVAHDLRNPLNVISSYCQAIKEMCSEQLDKPCRHYVHEIYDGTLRMNRLIEALLNFSRLTDTELNRERVDLSAMAREVAVELEETEAARRVEFRIAAGLVVTGDANLLRVVLTNIMGNAWKYTFQREEAVIEFGMKVIAGQPTFFVRDNGIGFANADVAKIFIPFQRLPGAEECRGFGIGLATVERIIKRHGGSVCAEGVPGKGATFYFTLQQ